VRLAYGVARDVIGAAEGVMNHVAVAKGERHCLSPILCQPDHLEAPTPTPDEWEVIAINSQVEHQHEAPECQLARASAAMGHRIIVEHLERDAAPASQVEAVRAYLCNLSSKEFKGRYERLLPTDMRGADFLKQYGELLDRSFSIDPDAVYPVRSRTGHPVYENERVRDFLRCVERARDGDDEEAKKIVMDIINQINGLRAIDAGPLAASRLVESVTPLLINVMVRNDMKDIGVKFL
jgi:galactokinase